jgi:hypothetical protein
MKLRKLLHVAAFVCVTFWGAFAAHAQDAERMSAARELMVASHAEEQFEKTFRIVFKEMLDSMPDNLKKTEKKHHIFKTFLARTLKDRRKVVEKMAAAYAQVFTAEELKAITAFYRTPAGKKLVEKTPELVQKIAKIANSLAMKTAQEALEKAQSKADQGE